MNHHDDQATDEESHSGETSSVGQALKAAREALDLPIKQLAGDLRIEPHYLVALEENDFAAFSAPVFAKGYLKQYATRLGLDEKGLLADYDRQVGTQELPTLRTPTFQSIADQQQARWLIVVSAVILVVAAISIWWFNTPAPQAPVVRQPGASSPVGEPGEPATPTAGPEAAVVEPPAPPAPSGSVGPNLQVEINFREDSWAEVIDARGERLFYGLGSAGERTRFIAAPPLSFFLGNASGVEVLVDEMPYSIPVESLRGDLARFVILESSD